MDLQIEGFGVLFAKGAKDFVYLKPVQTDPGPTDPPVP